MATGEVELVDPHGQVVAAGVESEWLTAPADTPLTACIEAPDALVLVELIKGPRRLLCFGVPPMGPTALLPQ